MFGASYASSINNVTLEMEIGCLPLKIHPLSLSLLLKFVSLYMIEKLYTIKSIQSFCPVPAHSVLPAPANDNEHSQMDGNRSQDPGGAIAGAVRADTVRLDRSHLLADALTFDAAASSISPAYTIHFHLPRSGSFTPEAALIVSPTR